MTKRLIGDSGKQEAHVAVELVNCTVGLNAGIGFRDETSVGQRCESKVRLRRRIGFHFLKSLRDNAVGLT